MPIKQKARVLILALQEAEITEECITNQGIRLNVRAVAAFKVGDDSGYISNLAAPHAAAAASRARIAKAQADMEAAEREMASYAMKSQYERDLSIKQAGYLAETQEAKARAEQSGPLAEAQAKQQVIQQLTALAQHEAELAAQRLEAEVRRPADAEAYRTRTLAEASRDQARFTTEAEAFRKRQLAEADRDQAKLAAEAEAFRQTTLADSEAKATRLRADAQAHAERSQAQGQADANQALAASLREGNQELIAASTLIENLPALVDGAARGLAGANLTVLNGTQGVNEIVAGLVGQGISILDLLKKSAVTAPATNGTGQAALDKIA